MRVSKGVGERKMGSVGGRRRVRDGVRAGREKLKEGQWVWRVKSERATELRV